MNIGKKVILSEYPFSEEQKLKLNYLSEKYNYNIITVRLIADFNILHKRRIKRDTHDSRHLGHIMTHYHYGDKLENRAMADDIPTKEDFKEDIILRQYNNFQLGKLYEIDVSDFEKVDYSSMIKEISEDIQEE